MNKIEEKDNSNKDILNQKLLNSESIIIGNWLKNLRLQNKQMKIEIIEEYLSLKEGDLLLIEEGLKNLDYITITKLIGIYCEDIETDTFQYIMKNINNNLSMNDNANILNKILDKCSLYILEEDKFKIIEINENDFEDFGDLIKSKGFSIKKLLLILLIMAIIALIIFFVINK